MTTTKKEDRMKKNVSFRKYEKPLYDYINDKSKVPDASAFIKSLIKEHMERELRDELREIEIRNAPAEPQVNMVEMLMQFQTGLAEQNRMMMEQQFKNLQASGMGCGNEQKKSLELYDPKKDIEKVQVIENRENKNLLMDLDL